jgi:hypothetical protein
VYTADALIRGAKSLFSGSTLSEEEKERLMLTINELYWRAKIKHPEQ